MTCTFERSQRVGVVGRTGSGKTTLISALFRLVEPALGRILSDGLDISTISFRDLGFRLGIIPQDPTLFRVTSRSNVDPLGEHEDNQIWEALKKCQLADIVQSLPEKLDAPGIISLEDTVEGLEALDQYAEVLICILCTLPGWNEKNIQSIGMFTCKACIACLKRLWVQHKAIEAVILIAQNASGIVLCLTGRIWEELC